MRSVVVRYITRYRKSVTISGDIGLINGDTAYRAVQFIKDNEVVKADFENGVIGVANDPQYDGIDLINVSKSDGTTRVMTGIATDPKDPTSASNVAYVNAVGQLVMDNMNALYAAKSKNEDIADVEISCRYKQGEGIRGLKLFMRDICNFPYKTQKEFDDLAMRLANSGRFNIVYPELHSKYDFELICLENKKCEVEFVWSKDDYKEKTYFIEVNLTPPIWTEDNTFDTEAAFIKAKRRCALKLGKRAEDFSKYEKKEVEVTVARSTLIFFDEVWGDRITKATIDYRKDNLIGAGQMRSSDWDIIYKNAGMSEYEIEQYRKAHEPFEAALNDSSDMYRD